MAQEKTKKDAFDIDFWTKYIDRDVNNKKIAKRNEEIRNAAPVKNYPIDEDEADREELLVPKAPKPEDQGADSNTPEPKPENTGGDNKDGIPLEGVDFVGERPEGKPLQNIEYTARRTNTYKGPAPVSAPATDLRGYVASVPGNIQMDYSGVKKAYEESKKPNPVEPVVEPPVEPEKPKPAQYDYDPTPNYIPDYSNQIPKDEDFWRAVQMLPEEERNSAVAQYLASGGQDAYKQYFDNKRYLEDPQAAARREAKDKRDQRLVSALNMIGALGNFVQAGAQSDGRSVPVANTTEALNKKLEAERKMRNENLAQVNALGNQYRQMAGGIIKTGYQNAIDREKAAQQLALAQARIDLSAQTAADRALNNQRNYELKQQEVAQRLLESQSRIRKNQAMASAAMDRASGKTGGTVSSKTHVALSDGTNTYFIRLENWQAENIAQAFFRLSPELQETAANLVVQQIAASGGDAAQAMALFSSSKTKFVTLNVNLLRIAIGAVMGMPGSEDMMEFIRSISDSGAQGGGNAGGGNGSVGNGGSGGSGGGNSGGKAPSPTRRGGGSGGSGSNGKGEDPTA